MRSSGMRGARRVALLCGLFAACVAGARPAAADVASDHPAAILVFPKLIVETSQGLDTLVRISNVSNTPINVYCFYVDATPQCSLGLPNVTSCFPDQLACFGTFQGSPVTGTCLAQWQETDFLFRLTQDQPTGWLVSQGEGVSCAPLGLCSNDGTTTCKSDTDCGAGNHCSRAPCLPLTGSTGNSGAVPLSPEDPFIGELKCIAVDEGLAPVARNDLIGETLIGRQEAGPKESIEVAGYNAIGIPALINTCQANNTCSLTGTPCQGDRDCAPTNNRDNTLVLGGPASAAEYQGCPNILILDHFFDGAVDPLVTNSCQPDGTCSVSGTPCINDNQCNDNICLPDNTCSVTGTACTTPADCDNTCVTVNTCTMGTCSVTAGTCAGNGDCPHNFCTLSNEHCLTQSDCSDPRFRTRVVTNLTLVPCTEDFENQRPEISKTTAQFLVFNEFEQRFSTSKGVECFEEIRLSDIDSGLDNNQNDRSIFSVGVEGTLTGQTRIQGVVDQGAMVAGGGNALLGVAEEFRCSGPEYQFPLCGFVDNPDKLVSATAKNLHFQGLRPQPDFIYLPQQQ